MNFELHPGGHGWHVHSVFSAFIPIRLFLGKIRSFGFGRVDVRNVDSRGVSEYLYKARLESLSWRSLDFEAREKALASCQYLSVFLLCL